jgi:hypothetical protein
MPVQFPNRTSVGIVGNNDFGIDDVLPVRNAEHGQTRPSRDEEFISDSYAAHPDRNERIHGTSEQQQERE